MEHFNPILGNETTGQKFQAEPFPPFIQNIIDKGGLIASIKAAQ